MTRTTLLQLTRQGVAAVDEAFLDGTPEVLPDNPSFTAPLPEPWNIDIDIDVDALRAAFPAGTLGPKHDPAIAMALHTELGIRRGVATEPRMWAWLAVRHTPDMLRRRWTIGGRPPNKNRFVGRLVDHGLARLWWAAELTRAPGADPEAHRVALERLLSSQYRTDRMLSTAILRHPPVVLGVLDAIGDDIRWQVLNQICQRLGLMATTYAIHAMSRDQVRALVGTLYRSVLADRDYPDEVEPNDP